MGRESEVWCSGHPFHSWGSAGPEEPCAQRVGVLASCGTSSRLGSGTTQRVGFLVVMDLVVCPRVGYPDIPSV
jgi:hypothetical protein